MFFHRLSVSPRLRVQGYVTLPTLFPHKSKEVVEEICRVVGPWRGLWVVLDRIDRQFPVPHALKSLIVEVDVSEFHIFVPE